MGLFHYFLFLTSIVFTNAQYIKHEDLEWKCGEITCPPRNTQDKDTKSLANSEYENQNARKCCDFCKSNGSLYCLKYSNESLGFNLLFEKGNDKECFCSNQVPDGCIYSENKEIRNVKICQNRLKAGLRPSIQKSSVSQEYINSQEYLIVKIVKSWSPFEKNLRNLKLHYAYQISDNMNHTRKCELIYHDEKLDKNKSYICEQWTKVDEKEQVEIPRENFEAETANTKQHQQSVRGRCA
uniref:Uncharacterized protein n=1 Tax=Acrobeloides nanus TaxID=290746 RepID=A0A914ENS0_9BILA